MNKQLAQIHQDDIEEIVYLIHWYTNETTHTGDAVIEQVAEDVLASIEFEDEDRAAMLGEDTVREVVRIVATALKVEAQ